MMGMVGGFSRQLPGGKGAVDDRAGGRAYRVEIRSVQILAADVQDRERLAVDLDGDLFGRLRDFDLRAGRRRDAQQHECEGREICKARVSSGRHGTLLYVQRPYGAPSSVSSWSTPAIRERFCNPGFNTETHTLPC